MKVIEVNGKEYEIKFTINTLVRMEEDGIDVMHMENLMNNMNFALIMGAEHSGISKSLLKLADFKVKIPMLTNFNSLNVSNATAIILFESVRQKLNLYKER